MDYAAHYDRLILKARFRTEISGYYERHHVTPKCLGGSDAVENLVNLTPEEHYVAHQLLVKIHPHHYGIAYAAMLMSRKGRGNGRVGNKFYGWLKVRFSKLKSEHASEQMKGNSIRKGIEHSVETRIKIGEKSKLMWLDEGVKVNHSVRVKKMWEDADARKRMTGNAVGKRTGKALENIIAANKRRARDVNLGV